MEVHLGSAVSTVLTMDHERFLAAAQGVLEGDDSIHAANELESVVLDDYAGDERFEALVYVLSMYSRGNRHPYAGFAEIRRVIQDTMTSIA